MIALISAMPKFVEEVAAALVSKGRDTLVAQLMSATMERCSYDTTVDAGYIYLVHPANSWHFAKLAARVAETIAFLDAGFNVDVDHDGHIMGIEFLSRADVLRALREAKALSSESYSRGFPAP